MRGLAILGGVVGFGFLTATSSIFNGYVLSVLWRWFVVPTFHAPQLTIVPAIGIAMVVGYLTYQYKEEPDHSRDELAERILKLYVFAILYPMFILCLGWIVHLFM